MLSRRYSKHKSTLIYDLMRESVPVVPVRAEWTLLARWIIESLLMRAPDYAVGSDNLYYPLYPQGRGGDAASTTSQVYASGSRWLIESGRTSSWRLSNHGRILGFGDALWLSRRCCCQLSVAR
jgi:hypothetical protein